MKISDFGGEFELIKRIADKNINDKNVIKGIGDDCAVLEFKNDKYMLITTDMMVENDHFNVDWSSPFQIGMKLMEVNVSDILSMAGDPKYAFVSMSLRKDTTVEFIDELYRGIKTSANKHGVLILGGDTTHGTELVFNLALLGEVDKELVRYRSGAMIDEVICVTGKLGGSTAGLRLLQSGKSGYLKDHLEPKSRLLHESKIIAKYATAMIDVSDGLSPDVMHICEESGVGAQIHFDKIPMSKETVETGKILNTEPEEYALYGGEDFELVFTIKEEDISKLRNEFDDFTVVGKIVDKGKGVNIVIGEKKYKPKTGYDHFK